MPYCPPPTQPVIGEFIIGEALVGVYYQDATCGVPTCGFAITAMWWAYVCDLPITLNGAIPGVTIITGANVTVSAPQAQMTLAGVLPAVTVVQNQTVSVGAAQMTLTALVPGFKLSQVLGSPAALLELMAGPATIRFVGQIFLWPSDCDEIDLVPATSTDLDLVPAVCTDIVLEPVRSR